ncbi:MAG: CehA/McbA family metallohydrolase domain-containing protein, partial [Planctomycetota bacterium]
ASQYDGRSWSPPLLIARSNGRQDVRVDAVADSAGELAVVFAADGRTRRFPYVPVDYDVLMASLAGFGKPMQPVELTDGEGLGQIAAVNPDPEQFPLPRKWTVGGKTYCLVLGDTHRHTDISRCMNGYDGSLQDAYRYALDACRFDWLAISDHDQDLLKHRNDRNRRPRQDYDWWRSQKYCDLYTIPGRFLALYGYEHGGSYKARGGHKNVVMAERGFPVYEVDSPPKLFAALADTGAVAIPHQLADGGSRTDWDQWDRRYEAVAEIFQTRGSYEYAECPRVAPSFTPGHSIWDALAKDVRIGIIASSDHGQTHQARAGVYVEDAAGASGNPVEAAGFSRHGIIEALHARRTFGSTTAAAFQVSVDGRPFGEEITVDGPPTLEARIVTPAEVTAVAVVRDNQFVYTTDPKSTEAGFSFRDLDLKPGQAAYYYVRALIGKNDVAWTSPIWVKRKK